MCKGNDRISTGVAALMGNGASYNQKNLDAVIRYLLVQMYNELRSRAHDCEHCSDVYELFQTLKKQLDEYGIKIHELTLKSS